MVGRCHGPLEFVERRRIQLAAEGTVSTRQGFFPDSLPDGMVGINSDYLK